MRMGSYEDLRLLFCEQRQDRGNDMILVTRKPVFMVCNEDRLKPACAAT